MKFDNIKISTIEGTAKKLKTDKLSGASVYEAQFNTKMNAKQWEKFKSFIAKESISWDIIKKEGTSRVIYLKINAGIGYSVWSFFFAEFLRFLDKNLSETDSINFKGITI